ncbi:uncharacterized protein L969DRAFT_84696 [Mixia osmundae IAM 14324]|nr:uncharacterized protein L969DRAFT_84696 [Mixia osmundae IAM 14324]KEI42811.1 hypothetical protein L969DRAFT_84696 [Mixia osmundae IAM 14324]
MSFNFGSFGQAGTSTPTSKPATFGSFGQAATSKPAATTGFSFGTPAASTSTAAPALTTTSSPFSFGTPAASKPPTSQSAPFSFGQSTTTPAAFGASTSAQQPSGFSFGGSTQNATAQNANPFGQSQPAQQQQQQQQQQQASAITKTTLFEDLPQEARQLLESIETHITGRIQVRDELKAKSLGQAIQKNTETLSVLSTEYNSLTSLLAQSSKAVIDARARYEQDLRDAMKVQTLVEGFRSPQSKGQAAKAIAQFPYEFFVRKVDELSHRLKLYKLSVEQIAHQLRSTNPDQVKAIVPTLRTQHALAMSLASSIARLHADVDILVTQYTKLWRDKTGSARDPFDEVRASIRNAASLDSLPQVDGMRL